MVMNGADMLQKMRDTLKPGGTADLVFLRLNSACCVRTSLINEALDEIERLPMMVQVGQPVTALQKLAIMLLKDSAYIE